MSGGVGPTAGGGITRRLVAGRVLAVANLAFWGANLFAFLVPFYLPRALQRYYCCGSGDDGSDRTTRTRGHNGEDKKDS